MSISNGLQRALRRRRRGLPDEIVPSSVLFQPGAPAGGVVLAGALGGLFGGWLVRRLLEQFDN